MASTTRRERGRAAITAVAQEHGLPNRLNLLSERWNTVAQLGESGVIAKAACLADLAKTDPLHWFRQELEVCSALAKRGAPVHRPLETPFGVSAANGVPVTLWHKVDGEMGACTEQEMVATLARVHEFGADLLQDGVWFETLTTHFADMRALLSRRDGVDQQVLKAILVRAEGLLTDIRRAELPTGFIHGDAQRKNAMRTSNGAVWIDLEECSVGPFAWDIACLTMNPRFDQERVLRSYESLTGVRPADVDHMRSLKELRELEGLTWMMAIRDEREPEFGAEADQIMRDVRARLSVD